MIQAATANFTEADVGSWVVVYGDKWYERLMQWLVNKVQWPVWLNHLLYEFTEWLLRDSNAGTYRIADVVSATELRVTPDDDSLKNKEGEA